MHQPLSSSFSLGILGGGQLGKMLCQAAARWDITTHVLDPDPKAPASTVATHFIIGSFRDYQTVIEFGQKVDMLTIEIEDVNLQAVEELAVSGIPVFPEPDCLKLVADKGKQKLFYQENQLPTANFKLYENAEEIRAAIQKQELKLPFVQKLRKTGYDGKGVLLVTKLSDLNQLFDAPSVVEDYVEDAKEIAVIASRNQKGVMLVYQVVEMVFNTKANLVEYLLSPARIPSKTAAHAQNLALDIMKRLNHTGLLAVELFIDKTDQLLINEIAPRPHNSGHHTIESAITSQYEQHLRAILGFPLGSTASKIPAVMVNLLGTEGYSGPVKYDGLDKALDIPGASLHIYGKKHTRPYRKMGHATIVDTDVEQALIKAKTLQNILKVIT